MFKKLKETKDLIKKIEYKDSKQLDEEGRIIIKINVSDDSSFLSTYYFNDRPIISSDTAEFINHSMKYLRPDEKVHFIFSSKVIDDNEKVLYKEAIVNYYKLEFSDLSRNIKRTIRQAIIMTLVAIVIFVGYILLDYLNTKTLILNIIDIAGWVFMWEAVDLFFLERSSLKAKQLTCYKIINAVVDFE